MEQIRKIIRRGDIRLIDFGNSESIEIRGVRPGVVVQNDIGNSMSNTVVVVPITSNTSNGKGLYPFHVLLTNQNNKLINDSNAILCEQIKCVGKEKIGRCLGILTENELYKTEHAIKYNLNL